MKQTRLARVVVVVVMVVIAGLLVALVALLTQNVERKEVREDAPLLISRTLSAFDVVAASGQVFWIDSREGGHSVYGYDPATQQEFLVRAGYNGALTSDGQQVTWLVAPDDSYKLKVQRYDPASKQQRTITSIQLPAVFASPFEDFRMFAADADTVYHVGSKDPAPSNFGLYAIDLATGNERLITTTPIDPSYRGIVASDGVLIWHEVRFLPPGPGRYKLPHTKLHAQQKNGKDIIITGADGCPGGYDISGSKVAWALGCGAIDSRVHLSDLQSGRTEAISSDSPLDHAEDPLISGNVVAWTDTPEGEPGSTNEWSLVTYDIATQSRTVLLTSDKNLKAEAIVGQDAVAYLSAGDPLWDLYLIGIK
ncbi:MAG TPA: hypothetical protein VGE45_20295 [Chloroflexia bacterium]|jgi:hypothetical protein